MNGKECTIGIFVIIENLFCFVEKKKKKRREEKKEKNRFRVEQTQNNT